MVGSDQREAVRWQIGGRLCNKPIATDSRCHSVEIQERLLALLSGPVSIFEWLQRPAIYTRAAGGISPNQLQRKWPMGQEGNDCESNGLIFVRYDEVNNEKKQAQTEY